MAAPLHPAKTRFIGKHHPRPANDITRRYACLGHGKSFDSISYGAGISIDFVSVAALGGAAGGRAPIDAARFAISAPATPDERLEPHPRRRNDTNDRRRVTETKE
jgi:hypothetical protein